MAKRQLPSKQDNPGEWYTRVIQLADLADYGPAKGTMIFKPYGYAIWEQIQKSMDPAIKARGVGNAYFPLFIPMSLLEKEADHVEGFAPELAVVTHGGGEELAEPLAIRPTSETIMYDSFSKWIQSWRDLPMQMNQWNNVVRWEKRTYMFMRTSEFLWQEGHTAHATHEEARETQHWAMDMYRQTYNNVLAMYGYVGEKSINERFAGADDTLTFESLMPSGKALQSCTSHDLGQNFAKPFDIKYQSKEGKEEYVWQTSWGWSTRSIGGLIHAHGDDNGLKLPPAVAPVQIVILPVRPDDKPVMDASEEVREQLTKAGYRVELDARDDESIGYRINKWEIRGAPVRLEIGSRELEQKVLSYARRDTGDKGTLKLANLLDDIEMLLDEIQDTMLQAHKKFTEENTRPAQTFDEMKEIIEQHGGFVKVAWNDDPKIEDQIQEKTKATSRLKLGKAPEGAKDFYTGEPATEEWLFAKAY